MGQGVLYEVMNMAALWKLPVIYVCENNMYNEYTHFSETTAGDILTRAKGFGVYPASADGQDVRAVYADGATVGGSMPQRRGPRVSAGEHVSLHGASRGRYQPRILSLQDRKSRRGRRSAILSGSSAIG